MRRISRRHDVAARRATGDQEWRRHAEHYSRLLEPKQYDRNVHDLGFIFLNTYLPWYRATGEDHLREVLITAGRTLALAVQRGGRYLRSFVAPESLFIDIMMNVPLIFYAAARVRRRCALSSGRRTLRYHRAHFGPRRRLDRARRDF